MPKQLSEPKRVRVTGCLLGWKDDQPVLMVNEDIFYLPIFSTEAKLRAMMERIQVEGYTIKHIDDGYDFLGSVKGQVKVCLDPHPHGGHVRFMEIISHDG